TLAAFIANGEALESAASAANTAGGLAVAKLGAANVARIELQQALNATSARDTQGKCVADADALLPVVNALKTRGNRIVFTNGCFDILHAGHVRYLQEARALGDQLVVAVNSDESVRGLKGDSRPINSLGARMEVLAALGCVDWVVPFDAQTPAALIDAIVPNVLVKGGDWPVEQIVGHGTVVASGGAVHSLPFAEGYSTTATIEKISRLTSG
ncbi:MAG: D-glycero-beta-D-manno-heptose 1-phosphate adenylyltransferase, partial [Pseudomonadota bacterium]